MADHSSQQGPSALDGHLPQDQKCHRNQGDPAQVHSPATPRSNYQQPPQQQYYLQKPYQDNQHPQHTQQQFGPGSVLQAFRPHGPGNVAHHEPYGMDAMMQGYQQSDYRQQSQYGPGNRGGGRVFHPGAGPSSAGHGQPMHSGPQFSSPSGGQAPMQGYYMPQQPQMMQQQPYYGRYPAMQSTGSPSMTPRHGSYGYYTSQASQAPASNYYYPQPSQYTHQYQNSHNQGANAGVSVGGLGPYSSPPFAPRRPSQSAAATGKARQVGTEPSQKLNEQRSHQGQGQASAVTVVRGPPRKPKQSGHAIWIGNLPPQTDLMSLVHHVCQQTTGLESLFLISKSNCAFANYPDEELCLEAQQKLNDSYYMAVRLVSRLRKNSVEGAQGATAPTGPAALSQSPRSPHIDGKQQHVDGLGVNGDGTDAAAPVARDGMDKPRKPPVQTSVIVDGSDKSGTKGKSYEGGEWGSSSTPVSSGSDISAKSEKYFILKSLTLEDLELSVRTGLWATQSHNEKTLNEAYKSCDNVYLIFSANKSGEYFGYARMTSEINQDPAAAIEFAPTSQSFNDADLPKAIPTEATETTPRGRIIDDSARGTIFWEIQSDDAGEVDDKVMGDGIDNVDRVDGVDSPDGPDGVEGEDGIDSVDGVDGTGGSQTWGKPFKLEWLSTTRLPFYRTRGLRNPLNANREIKIARDGTDVDVAIGRKLVSLFRQEATSSPAAGSGSGSGSSRAGMPSSSSYSSLPGT